MEIVKKCATILKINPVYECYNSHENTSLPLGPTAPSTVQNLYILNESRGDKEVILTDPRLLQMWVFYECIQLSYMMGK